MLGQGTAVFESLSTYIASLEKLKGFASSRIYPGHGPVVENGKSVIQEYIAHRLQREAEILNLLESTGPKSIQGIVEIIYAKYPKQVWKAAENSVKLHLEKCREEESVIEKDGIWLLNSSKL